MRRLAVDWESFVIESQGLSGGIVMLWRRGVASIEAFCNCPQQVVMVISEPNEPPWVLCGVYASTDYRTRRLLWGELSRLLTRGVPTMVVGDFNCILAPSEKRGGRVYSDSVDRREFREFMNGAGLVDLGFTGPRFTWCNNQSGRSRVWERLDRAIASADWIQRFPSYQVSHLARIASDHCPILISTASSSSYHSPFHFEKLWLSYPQSWRIVREAWGMPVQGDAMQRVSRRLELTKRRLRRWNRKVVGNIFRRLEEVEGRIADLQGREDRGGELEEGEMSDLRRYLASHHSLLHQQETMWRQKSRVQWVKEGDRNTRFFHRSTVIRRQRNMIRSLRVGTSQWVVEDTAVRQVLLDFFRSRWTEVDGPYVSDQLPRPAVCVEESENAALIQPVSNKEVQEAVWSLWEDKAPGPDGFPPFFFHRY
ncbi:uncharacterized protein LOC120110929 [Phoenix dactylifera]|uniref:Uncharacterized protein LOC120110929 n=1 Tax=Phoenix dactylifera TaxID=42345 RepID=A0A8B9A8A7_PHODC|nr:uncharacterized protein LOC120110929 [Phoenix dactylifera]